MIKILNEEYCEGNLAIKEVKVTFFNIPIYKVKKTTTNRTIVSLLKGETKPPQIKGFTHETKH